MFKKLPLLWSLKFNDLFTKVCQRPYPERVIFSPHNPTLFHYYLFYYYPPIYGIYIFSALIIILNLKFDSFPRHSFKLNFAAFKY